MRQAGHRVRVTVRTEVSGKGLMLIHLMKWTFNMLSPGTVVWGDLEGEEQRGRGRGLSERGRVSKGAQDPRSQDRTVHL